MLVQIGMRCEPQWFCQTIGWLIAALVLIALLGLVTVIRRERRKNRRRKFHIHFKNQGKDE